MNILIIDSSSSNLSIALISNNEEFIFHKNLPRKHNDFILCEIDNLLQKSNLKIQDLNALSYGIGAGSFVGVRLSCSIVQGLSIVNNIKVIPFSSLFLNALTYIENQENLIFNKITIVQDAKMNDIYIGQYEFINNSWHILQEYSKKISDFNSSDILEKSYIFGDASNLLKNIKFNNIEIILPHIKNIIPFIKKDFENNKLIDALNAQPIYLQGIKNWKKI